MSAKSASVRCMILPLSNMHLVVPNSAVSEIIGYSPPRKFPDTSKWFSGVVLWRGVYVPVISVEKMCATGIPETGPRARIAIIYNPAKDDAVPYIGIQMKDIPRAYLAESDGMEYGDDEGLNDYLLSRMDDPSLGRVIPNLDKMITDLKVQFNQRRIEELSR